MKTISISRDDYNKHGAVYQLFGLIFLILCLLIVIPISVSSQEEIEEEVPEEELVEKQVITISELAGLMRADEKVIILSNLDIIHGNEDNSFIVDRVLDTVYEITPLSQNLRRIHFFDCDFSTGNKELIFKGWHLSKLDLLGCKMNSPLIFENLTMESNFPINIDNCAIRNTLEFRNKDHGIGSIKIINSVFGKNLVFNSNIQHLILEKCRFNADVNIYKKEDEEKTHFQLGMKSINIGTVEINSCEFTSNEINNLFSVDFRDSEIENLSMFNNTIHSIDLSWSTVEKSLLVDSLLVEAYIGILNFDFPEKNTNIPWYNFSGEKLALLYNEENEELLTAYQAKTNDQLSNTLDYNDLISSYTKFNTLYHDRGDIHSANKSYVEIKNLETRRQEYLLNTTWDFNVYINYKLNVFLSFFSDYATNPGKSLIQSLWVLLIFTILYMLSYSKWDELDYAYLLKQYADFSKYIKTDDPIEKIYGNQTNDKIEEIETIVNEYIKSGKSVPKVLKFIGTPLYQLGKFRYRIVPGLIRVFNFQPEKWEDVIGIRRVFNAALIFLISFFFLLYVLIVKFLASTALSLNSFVLIGFGQPPEKGLAMYLSIIEGIIGWFLLTIFTITLFSQVLQNA